MKPDPDFDLPAEQIRRLGRAATDLVADHLGGIAHGPVFGKIGAHASWFDEPLPEAGRDADALLELVRERVLPFPFGNSHPRFFAFINATADPVGIVADLVASAMNPNCWGGDHAAIHVERQALSWIAELLGYPADAEGVLTSGGSMANFTALAAARRATCPDVRDEGLPQHPRPVVYVSDQVHHCVDKSADLLGFGRRFVRRIATDERFRMRVDALEAAIAADRAAGLRPTIVVGSAGTVNTGAIDPLVELADLAAREGMWFHADGAYGALAAIAIPDAFVGLTRADSIAADPHKWLYVPYEAGATLVRRKGGLTDAFARPAEYLDQDPESPLLGPVLFSERGPELSRRFRALKVWLGILRHGRQGYARAIAADLARAKRLAELVQERPETLELAVEPTLSIVCFRYAPKASALDEQRLDRLNRRIANRWVADGSFFLAPTVLRGRTYLRAAIVNFRTAESDLVALRDATLLAGAELEKTV